MNPVPAARLGFAHQSLIVSVLFDANRCNFESLIFDLKRPRICRAS